MKDDSQASYNYAPKSRLIYQRSKGDAPRSRTSSRALPIAMKKTPSQVNAYTGNEEEVKSRLSKASIQRFNEQLPEPATLSQKSKMSLNAKSLKSIERPSMKKSMVASQKTNKSSVKLDQESLKALEAAKK